MGENIKMKQDFLTVLRDESFPNKDGDRAWSIMHDSETKTVVIHYNDELFGDKFAIDYLTKSLQSQLHEVRRRYGA
jgi:hypothetical protein